MDPGVYERMRALQDGHWWFEGRRQILSTLIGDLDLPKNAKVLEVGCGPGGNLPMLKQFGQVTAMEPDAGSRAFAAEKSGVTIESGLLPGPLPFAPESFDLVCAFDVIEHVDDDAGSVVALGRLLKRGGYLATTVPGQPWMWSRHDELHHHKRRYRMAAFRQLFLEAGLEIVRASYFNTFLFAPIAAIRAAKMATGSRSADDDGLPAPAINSLLKTVFAAERRVLRRAALPFGVSIVLIAKKSA
ncbi:MAG TPA: methyltransferase domain-containing protein [Caulobacteraceae bacterium]|jgi:SAM-dependent methyltransferase